MKPTTAQAKVIDYIIEQGAKVRGRWVDTFPKGLRAPTLDKLVEHRILETKSVPVPRSKWPRRKGTRSCSTVFYRFRAGALNPQSKNPRIAREILRAVLQAKSWTPWRPFHDLDEHLGAMKCGTMPRARKCEKRSTHVSYTTPFPFSAGCGIQGRVACCAYCVSRSSRA